MEEYVDVLSVGGRAGRSGAVRIVQFAFAIADDLSTPEDPSGLAVEGKGEYTLAFPAGKEDGVFAEDGGGMAF